MRLVEDLFLHFKSVAHGAFPPFFDNIAQKIPIFSTATVAPFLMVVVMIVIIVTVAVVIVVIIVIVPVTVAVVNNDAMPSLHRGLCRRPSLSLLS